MTRDISGGGTPCRPVGIVRNGREDASDRGWGGVVSRIELDPDRFDAEALRGLDEFSHAEIVFFFHALPEDAVELGTRHPRNNPDWPLLGIFAQRASGRPNRLGVSRARIRRIDGRVLEVEGLDAIDGTPVLVIKPWMREFGPAGDVRQPAWCGQVMSGYFEE
jgi:tRNA-Thr(GGU) m(6)t(6)A37 methyltransferase TsaA